MGAQVSLPQGIEGSALGMDSLPLDTLGPSSTINAKRLLMAVAVTGPSSEERLRFIERLSTVPIATSYGKFGNAPCILNVCIETSVLGDKHRLHQVEWNTITSTTKVHIRLLPII